MNEWMKQELDVRGALGVAFCLRHRMQHFLENYVHYMLFEVRGCCFID